MRILGVDYGDSRTGLAFSDISGSLAGEAFVITMSNPDRLCDMIAAEAAKRSTGQIVLGYPRNMDGTAGDRAQKSEQVKALLEQKTGLEVILWDERLTTVSAHIILSGNGRRERHHKNVVDAVAATLILQSYLDARRNA